VRRTLVVLRHAKSDWSGGEADRDRPLAGRGRRQAPEAGAWLAENLDNVDLAVVSPAVRARETWRLASAELSRPPEVRVDDRVYAAWGRGLLAVVADLPPEASTVALVGHNPSVEDLVEQLVGEWVRMPTSALAVVEWDGAWSDPTGAELRAAGRPPG
jgi:phosphohistidine phosphatase